MSESTTQSPIRTGLIGFGLAGRVFHAPFLAADPDYSLDVIATGNPDRQGQAAAQHPGARVVATAEDLLAAASDLDLVIVATPPVSHADLADAALDAGVAVVVDKPFAATADAARALIEKAERMRLPLTVFQNRRWDADFLTLRKLIGDGALGDVRRFESRFEVWKPVQTKAWKAEATVAEAGGTLFDFGAHLIDQALQLFGPVESLDAEVETRRSGGGADDDVFVALRHASGVRSHLWMNTLAAQPGPRFRVLGSDSAYTKWGFDGQEAALAGGALPSDPDYGVEPESAWGNLGIDGSLTPVPAERGSYDRFYSGLADAILRGADLPVDPRDSLRVVEIIEQVHREFGRT
ncbi:Gfo/Idh/MocA family protein [Glaciibacter sp. 2TAF33]|uniref:Gfo/Idh/MocA family protein n=1 Tax=Glaciibacter sp. 2TAF33 TaxID=3233015 RepID=UPI003F91D378